MRPLAPLLARQSEEHADADQREFEHKLKNRLAAAMSLDVRDVDVRHDGHQSSV